MENDISDFYEFLDQIETAWTGTFFWLVPRAPGYLFPSPKDTHSEVQMNEYIAQKM